MKYLLLFSSLLFLSNCENKNPESSPTDALNNFQLTEIKSPVGEGGEPNLFVSKNGNAYLTWVEYLNDTTDALMFSKLEKETWSAPIEIARGNDWFVNWADFPSFVVYKNNENHMAAHWLQKRAAGTYDYDIHISQSKDGGKTWGKSFLLHTDGVAAEHGFVTMLPQDDGKIFATWLDGRFTKTGKETTGDHDHGHGGGPMTLRTANFDIEGNLSNEKELDNRVCDCCQTTATIFDGKTLVAYRDRSVDEIRDISFVQKTNKNWNSSSSVFPDNWKIAGCPVNGPSLASNKNQAAIAWFSLADTIPKVQFAYYNAEHSSFEKPIRLDQGKPLGRVGISLLENQALVTWLEKKGEQAEIKMVSIFPNNKKSETVTISKTNLSRNSGFPQIEKTKDKVIFAWTDAGEKTSTVKTAFWKY